MTNALLSITLSSLPFQHYLLSYKTTILVKFYFTNLFFVQQYQLHLPAETPLNITLR